MVWITKFRIAEYVTGSLQIEEKEGAQRHLGEWHKSDNGGLKLSMFMIGIIDEKVAKNIQKGSIPFVEVDIQI